MGSDGVEPDSAASPVDGPGPDAVPAAEAEPGPAGARSRRPVVAIAAVSAVLLVASVVLGVLFARERSAHDESDSALRGERARVARVEKDLAAVRAERADLEARLAAAEAQRLGPEAKLAISACVKVYAEIERVMAQAGATGRGQGSVRFMLPVAGGDAPGAVCGAAEPHLAKLG